MPPPERTGPGWLVFSVLVNFALMSALVWLSYRGSEELTREQITFIALDERGAPEVAMLYVPPQPGGHEGEATVGKAPRARPLTRALAPIAAPRVDVVTPPRTVPDRVHPMTDSSAAETIGTRRHLGPSFGDGRVWRAPELTMEEKIEVAVRMAQLDDETRDRLVQLLAEVPPDSFAYAMGQSWTTEIGGKTWGFDGQWIHLGGIKIPAAILALIPLPQGNILASRDATKYEAVRREIIENARRQEDMEDIKKNIKALRERMDAERKAAKEGIAKRDSVIASRDTIIP
jgi:hypothetical protein